MEIERLSLKDSESGVSIGIRVQPRAGRNKVLGVHDGNLKIAVAAPPVDGEATRQCQKFLAEILNITVSRVELLSGALSRNKAFRITGMNAEECRKLLTRL